MNVLLVASEMAPFAKTGGLADVIGALPRHLHRAGHDVRVFLPLYDRVDTSKAAFEVALEGIEIRLGAHQYRARIVRSGKEPEIYFVDCPALFRRGGLYTNDADEHRRFLALCWGALAACQRMGFAPDVIHCNDWQTAMLPLTLKTHFAWDRLFAKSKTLLTIHNLNYQGLFPAAILPDTNLLDSAHLLHQDQLRDGRINFLLHGILYADGVSTVSPTYAAEIQTPEHGAGLDPFLRARKTTVVGILNGVDYDIWSPQSDTHIPHRYGIKDLGGKELNKQQLLTKLGLPYIKGVPVMGIVSRLAGQKGFGLLGEVMPELLRRNPFQLVVLGTGEPSLEDMFSRMQRAFPKQVCFYKGFLDPLAHLIEAGADMFLMPSRYEPCGLNQMYSLRYGTVPVVHRTGGLADTVIPWSSRTGRCTGFLFEHHDAAGLAWAVRAALTAYGDQTQWRRLQRNGMAQDFSWETQGKIYETLYSRLQANG
ncbi:MAG TPA: glycogen synthase GlgA [Planctomycetota bacterium]|nr:glycogen synthase GlgA [Planctomycetota bacterium]